MINEKITITREELRKRWTIELNSLGKRPNPTNEQESRIRDLTTFLAAIDPLRKYEFDWRNMPGFNKKFVEEIMAQHLISDQTYRNNIIGKILIALVGTAKPQPSQLCTGIKEARTLCEDHGMEWNSTLGEIIKDLLIRKSVSDELSMSPLGCNFVDKYVLNALKPKSSQSLQDTSGILYERLSNQVRSLIGALKLEIDQDSILNTNSNPRSFPDINRHTNITKNEIKTPKTHSNEDFERPLPSMVHKKKDNYDSVVNLLKRPDTNPVQIIYGLTRFFTANYNLELLCEDPASWGCDLSISIFPDTTFSGIAYKQNLAKTEAAKTAIPVLIEHFEQIASDPQEPNTVVFNKDSLQAYLMKVDKPINIICEMAKAGLITGKEGGHRILVDGKLKWLYTIYVDQLDLKKEAVETTIQSGRHKAAKYIIAAMNNLFKLPEINKPATLKKDIKTRPWPTFSK